MEEERRKRKEEEKGKDTGLQMLQVVLLLIRSLSIADFRLRHTALSAAVLCPVWPGLCIVSEAQIVTSSTDTRRHKTLSL